MSIEPLSGGLLEGFYPKIMKKMRQMIRYVLRESNCCYIFSVIVIFGKTLMALKFSSSVHFCPLFAAGMGFWFWGPGEIFGYIKVI